MQIVKSFEVLLFNNNSIPHYSFIYTLLNDSKYCYVSLKIKLKTQLNHQTILFQTIQFSISHLFA